MSKSFYKCGHDRKPVIMENSILTLSEYFTWKEGTGFEGDKTECWECCCKRRNKEIEAFKKGTTNNTIISKEDKR